MLATILSVPAVTNPLAATISLAAIGTAGRLVRFVCVGGIDVSALRRRSSQLLLLLRAQLRRKRM